MCKKKHALSASHLASGIEAGLISTMGVGTDRGEEENFLTQPILQAVEYYFL
jgi:hypothetical protein